MADVRTKLTEAQEQLTRAARGKEGPYRVGWNEMYGQPYHVAGCRFWPQVNGWGTHGFETENAAQEAGHQPANCCAAKGERRLPRESETDTAESACGPASNGLCSTHPTCERVKAIVRELTEERDSLKHQLHGATDGEAL